MQRMYICSKYINENDENFDSTEDNEPTFSSSFFRKDLFLI